MIRAGLLLAASLAGLAQPAAADTAARIAGASQEVAEAGKVLAAARAQPQQVAALGRAIGAYEAALGGLRAGVAEAAADEAGLAQDLADRSIEIARLVATLEKLSLAPAPALPDLHPEGPLGAARAAAMAGPITPALHAEAERLRGQLEVLQAARSLREQGTAAVAAATGPLDEAHAAMSAILAAAAPEADGLANPALTLMARDSETLSALAAALSGQDGAPPPPAAADGDLAWPVEGGEVIHGFGEKDAAGVQRPGIVVAAPPFSLVSAPADAIVRYAGPFLEYGYVVVLEPDSERMLVLAGLSRLQVATGAAVERGELLGMLGARAVAAAEEPAEDPEDAQDYVMPPESDGAGGSETLYIEVRQGRGPVDPEPLFTGEDG